MIAALLVLLLVAAGCTNARFQEASEVRKERIRRITASYVAHDREGGQRIRTTIEREGKAAELRAELLAKTRALVRSQHEHDVARWRDERSLRRDRLHDILRGHPETCPGTWADMIY